MNYVSGISDGMGRVADGITATTDGFGLIEYSMTNGTSPYSVSPAQATVDLMFVYIGGVGGLPGIIISSSYFLFVRSGLFDNQAAGPIPYSPVPNVDNARVYMPQYQ